MGAVGSISAQSTNNSLFDLLRDIKYSFMIDPLGWINLYISWVASPARHPKIAFKTSLMFHLVASLIEKSSAKVFSRDALFESQACDLI